MAQLVIAAAGAAVGSFFGAPQLGFAIGSAIGGALFAPTQKQQGPRLSDLRVSGTETGQPIPYFEGKFRTAGQIAWASDRREIATTTEQGKGGPSVESTTYTYEVDMLYLLSDHEAETFARVWDNGKLVFNNLPDADIGTVVASSTTDRWRRITFYSGAADQLPDPTYEAAVGVGNAPAYRGRATIFIEGLQLGGNGQIPNLSFEVFRDTTTADVSAVFDTIPIPSPVGTYEGAVYKNSAWYVYNDSGTSTDFTFLKSKRFGAFKFKRRMALNGRFASNFPVWVQTNATPRSVYASFNGALISAGMHVEQIDPETGVVTDLLDYVPSGDADVCNPAPRVTAYDEVQGVYVIGSAYNFPNDPTSPFIIPLVGSSNYVRCTPIPGLTALAAHDGYIYALAYSSSHWRVCRYDYTGTFVDEVEDTADYYAASGTTVSANWIRVDEDGQAWVFNELRGRLFKITTIFEEVSTPANVDSYSGNSQDGVFYCTENFVAFGIEIGATDVTYNFRRFKAPTAAQPTLQAVVERLCARAGLDSSQYDASALSTITRPVRSMAISQVTPIRQVMETLAGSFFFGAVLSDKLYFRPRGGTSVATIPYADLGAGEGDAQSEPLEIKVTNQLEVPAQIALTYSNVNGDYNVATEYSDRLLTDQASTSAIQVPLGFTPSEAKGIAETLVADASAGVFTTTVSLMSDYARLEPTDVVSVVDADGSSYRMRVTKKTESGPVISLDLVADDASVLTSAGITSDEYTSSTVVTFSADTMIRLLDIPILRDVDDPLGIYVAFAGESSPWPGAKLFKSVDDATYESQLTVSDQAGIGATSSALTTWARGFVFDESSTVTVVMEAGTLSSYTRAQVLSGIAPPYLIGSEIVYAKNATLIAADTYLLSGFLRGIKGTDWAMPGHAAGETFVVLSTTGLRRQPFATSEISATSYFKGVTLGRRLSTADAEQFVFAAVGKRPYAPCNLRAARIAAGTSDDANFDKVQLLLHGEGTNLAQVFTDSSTFARTPTVSGNTQTRTAQFQFGASSMYFDGTGDYLTYTSMPTISGDFVLDMWIRPDSVTAGQGRVLFDNRTSSSDSAGFALYCFGTGVNVFSANANRISSSARLAATTWAYIALRRVSGVMQLYINGTLEGSWTTSASFSRNRAVIGRDDPSNNQFFIGYIDELRLKVGDGEAARSFGQPLSAYADTVVDSSATLTWNRRTRFSKNFTTGTAPLGEAQELYDVVIYADGTYTTVIRTERVSTNSYVYSRADQISDFGSFQSTLYVDVYQVNDIVGRGYKLRGFR